VFITAEIFDCKKFEIRSPEFKLYVHNLSVIFKILITKKITFMCVIPIECVTNKRG